MCVPNGILYLNDKCSFHEMVDTRCDIGGELFREGDGVCPELCKDLYVVDDACYIPYPNGVGEACHLNGKKHNFGCSICDTAVSATELVTLHGSCNDENPYTFNDTCIDGVCIGTPFACPATCTTTSELTEECNVLEGTCDSHGCVYNAAGACWITEPAFGDRDGRCVPDKEPKSYEGLEKCWECNSTVNDRGFVRATQRCIVNDTLEGTKCVDEGYFDREQMHLTCQKCFPDQSIDGYSLEEGWCFFQDPDLDTSVTCHLEGEKKGACLICDPIQNTTDWSLDNGVACNDDDACTYDDACIGGACAGTPFTCPICKRCDGKGNCDLMEGWCFIDGECYRDQEESTIIPCSKCDAAKSFSLWSIAVGQVAMLWLLISLLAL